MTTLHLPKKRPIRSHQPPGRKVRRALDEDLEETVPANDPGSETEPTGAQEALSSKPAQAAKEGLEERVPASDSISETEEPTSAEEALIRNPKAEKKSA